MSATPLQDDDVRLDLTQQIRDAILAGRYAPHQRLIEADISDEYGVSRAAVRTALLTLSGDGLVERMPNKGARVRSISVDEAIEIVEVRIGLESLCARKAAELVTEEEIEELAALRAEMIEAVDTGHLIQYSELNQRLDQRLREISGHETAVRLLERLRAQSARHQFRLALHPGRAAQSCPEHAAIIDAVTSRDADAAEAATRTHLEGIVAVLRHLK